MSQKRKRVIPRRRRGGITSRSPAAATPGQRLERFRLDRGLSQEKLAALLGVDRSTVAKIEAGQNPSKLTAHKIEKLLSNSRELGEQQTEAAGEPKQSS